GHHDQVDDHDGDQHGHPHLGERLVLVLADPADGGGGALGQVEFGQCPVQVAGDPAEVVGGGRGADGRGAEAVAAAQPGGLEDLRHLGDRGQLDLAAGGGGDLEVLQFLDAGG